MNRVHIVYLTPSDKAFVPAYQSALEDGARDLQTWFARQMAGRTFALAPAPVAWQQLPNPASWYEASRDERAAKSADLCWERTLEDAFALTGADFDQPDARWVFYLDAFPACGQSIGGTSGVALNGGNDLRGLNGESFLPPCPGEPAWEFSHGRWIGGMGHELGHALGLDHPADSPGGPDDCSLMYLGYLDYPNTYLTPDERQALEETGFFYPEEVAKSMSRHEEGGAKLTVYNV